MNDQETLQLFLKQQLLLLDSLPYAISIKDRNLAYVYFNSAAKQLNGFCNSDSFLYKDDFAMPWYKQAKLFEHGGNKVLKGEQLISLDPITNQQGHNMTLLSRQTPVYNLADKIIAITVSCQQIANHKALNYSKVINDDEAAQFSQFNAIRIHNGYNLTTREQQCLYWLLRGQSAREIAKILSLSPRTIEGHLEILKQKFNVSSKTQLIDKALNSGALSSIPEGIKLAL